MGSQVESLNTRCSRRIQKPRPENKVTNTLPTQKLHHRARSIKAIFLTDMAINPDSVGVVANKQDNRYSVSMKAKKIVQRRVVLSETAFVGIVVWHVPEPVPGSTHPYKYRLAYVFRSACVLRYDNEAGKGDHRHVEGREEPYRFSSPRQLVADFYEEIRRWNDAHADH